MQGEPFDRLTRMLATRGSRRRALGGIVGGVIAGGLSLRQPGTVSATTYTEDEIKRIIRQAADMYEQPRRDMLRVAYCESRYNPRAYNPSGPYYGLFQFLQSTFNSTPYADHNIYNPKANARAAAWMWSVGRRNEWACQ
jgi:hypothetical protein